MLYMVKNLPVTHETGVQSWVRKTICREGNGYSTCSLCPISLRPSATLEQRNFIEPLRLQGVALGFKLREAPSSNFRQSSAPLSVSCIAFGIFPLEEGVVWIFLKFTDHCSKGRVDCIAVREHLIR